MGYRLFREVLEHRPRGVPAVETLVWLVIADDANETTRRSWIRRDLLSRRAGVGRTRLKAAFRWFADHSLELREELGKGSDGRPVFAHRGAAVTYVLPHLTDTKGVGVADPLSDTERGSRDGERGSREALKGVGVADPPSTQSPQLSSAAEHDITEDEIRAWLVANKGSTNPKALLRTDAGPRLRTEAVTDLRRQRVAAREAVIADDPAGWSCYWCQTRNRGDATHCRYRACGEPRKEVMP